MKWNGNFVLIFLFFLCSCQEIDSENNTTKEFIYDIVPLPQEIIKDNSFFKLSSNQTLIYDTLFKNEAYYLKNYFLSMLPIYAKRHILFDLEIDGVNHTLSNSIDLNSNLGNFL